MNNNQTIQVLNHLKLRKSVPDVDVIWLFKCYRLCTIIKNLRNQGYDIVKYNERNSSGNRTHARYEMQEV